MLTMTVAGLTTSQDPSPARRVRDDSRGEAASGGRCGAKAASSRRIPNEDASLGRPPQQGRGRARHSGCCPESAMSCPYEGEDGGVNPPLHEENVGTRSRPGRDKFRAPLHRGKRRRGAGQSPEAGTRWPPTSSQMRCPCVSFRKMEPTTNVTAATVMGYHRPA
jgi:hypothetical protein